MPFRFGRKKEPTVSELEDKRDKVQVEEEIVTRQASIEERKAVIAELKRKYGSGWARTLGISKLTDLSTLRSFLVSAKQNLSAQGRQGTSPLRRQVEQSSSPLSPDAQMSHFGRSPRA